MTGRQLLDAWLGHTRFSRVTVGAWRLASVGSGSALVAPIMLVGRRPYRLGRLAERLRAVQDMAVIPDALPTQLRWLQLAVVATVASGLVLPVRFRRLHPLVSLPALVLAILVRHGATQSDWTTPTNQLLWAIVLLGCAVVLAWFPVATGSVAAPTQLLCS